VARSALVPVRLAANTSSISGPSPTGRVVAACAWQVQQVLPRVEDQSGIQAEKVAVSPCGPRVKRGLSRRNPAVLHAAVTHGQCERPCSR